MTLPDIISIVMTQVPTIVTAAAAAAAAFPQPAPGSPWATLRAIIDVLALNVGNAENKPKGPHIK